MSSSEVEARNIALSVEGSMDTSSAECLDTAPAPAPGSRRKSVENLVISSQDAIGQSISQALTFSGVITQHAQQIGTQENRNLSRSPSPCRPLQEPASAETLDNDKNDGQSLLLPPNSAGDTISISSQMEIASLRAGDVLLRGGTSPPGAGAGAGGGPRAKKKSWYSALYPTYKSRSDDFKRLFRDLPEDERLIVDYSCALQKDILAHGRLYVSQNYLCFYANIFGWETNMLVRWKDVTAITKEKTALVIPNAILVCTDSEKSFLTSFSGRDKAYLMLFRVWQNALMDQQMGSQEVWQWVHSCYGEELGFNSDDDEYVRDEDKMAAASLAHDTIGEEYLETSSLGGGDDPYSPARLARADDAISTTSLPTATTQHPAFARSVSQPPPPPITLTSPVSNGGGYEDAGDTLPTDMSDSSDSDPDKQPAGGVPSAPQCQDKHEGRCILHMEVACNIDHLFTMLFTNSKFCLELLATRNTSDYIQSPWKHNPETGLKCRQVSYTMALTQPIGPKCVHITETQVMNNCSKPGQIYSIDLSTMNAGVPYSDSFYVVNHYCMQRRSEQLTALYIYCSIKYKKSVWGIVKGFIEKNAWAGLEDYCRTLESALLRETDSERAPGKRKGKRRRRATSSSQEMSAPGASKSPAAVSALLAPRPSLSRAGGAWDAAGAARAPQRDTSGARWLLGILALLLLLNLLLYWKLYYAQPRPFVIGSADYDDKMGAASAEEWTKLLEQQSHERRGQLDSWSEALHRAIHTLRQTEQALGNLLETIRPSLEKAQAEGAEAGAAAAGEPRADL